MTKDVICDRRLTGPPGSIANHATRNEHLSYVQDLALTNAFRRSIGASLPILPTAR